MNANTPVKASPPAVTNRRQALKDFPNLSLDDLLALYPCPSTRDATDRFCNVREKINPTEYPQAYRVAYGLPLLFYLEYSEQEAYTLLLRNATSGMPWYLWK